jgi:hypothetical protein
MGCTLDVFGFTVRPEPRFQVLYGGILGKQPLNPGTGQGDSVYFAAPAFGPT